MMVILTHFSLAWRQKNKVAAKNKCHFIMHNTYVASIPTETGPILATASNRAFSFLGNFL
jgi:hypothetical protein